MHISLLPKESREQAQQSISVAIMVAASYHAAALPAIRQPPGLDSAKWRCATSKAFTFSSVCRLEEGYNVTDDTARQ
jgi:hypothetical protein